MNALIVGNGRVPPRHSLPGTVFADVSLVVAADGGAAGCEALGLRPDLVVGDFDSADPDLVARLARDGIPVLRVPAAKDESDLELALAAALDRGADRVVALGALGGTRIEHALAAIALLQVAADRGADLAIVDDRSTLRLLDCDEPDRGGRAITIEGEPGDYVSLLPAAGDVRGVVTDGLRFPLRDEALRPGPSRGLSNELLGSTASVRARSGRLLVVHTRRSVVEAAAQHPGEE